MLFNIFGKNWYQSFTAWGVVLFSAAKGAEQTGLLPPGVADSLLDFGQAIGAMLIALGIRKAANSPNVGR